MTPPIAILGATATGKSALALRLASALGAEIVNADALLVYRGLDLGTAKPTLGERARVRHHLLDWLDPRESCSAGEFARRGREALAEIGGRGARVLVVGGSGFYVQALLDGLGALPASDQEIRLRLRTRLEREGIGPLYDELRTADPPTAARLAPRDSQRVLRALEVHAATGVALSTWHARQPLRQDALPAVRVGLTLPRALLYDRIEKRLRAMVAAGWVEEVAALLAAGVPPSAPGFQAIGYRQIVDHLAGRCSLASAVAEATRQTRRLAKRQETWFRRDRRIRWCEATDPEQLYREVAVFLAGCGVRATE